MHIMAIKKYPHSDWLLAILFLFGIALTVSNGNWFPSLNLAGISLIGLVGHLSAK